MKYLINCFLLMFGIPVSAMDSLKLQAHGMDMCDHEEARLIKTYGMDPKQAKAISAARFEGQLSIPRTPSRCSLSQELKAEAHLKEVTVQQVEYTKRQTACYAATTGVISAVLTAAVTLTIHFTNCKQ